MGGSVKLTGKIVPIAEEALRFTAEVLENAKIPYVLEAGTLLGVVREDRLLPWDTDMDITISSRYTNQILSLRRKFWLKGYRTRIRYFERDMGPFKKGTPRILRIQTRKFLFLKGVHLIDIFLKELIDERYYWTVGVREPVLKSTPRAFYEQFTTYPFRGKQYSVPQDYIGYLEYHYGDWKTPKKDWDYRLDDKCSREIL
jgi:phosphorylcholine metabolism protein LicD